MNKDHQTRQNRIRETLDKLYDQHPPHFREQLQRFREDPASRVFAPLAEGYRRMGRVDEAIKICQEGLQHHPDFHSGRVALAKCFVDKKQFVEARQELDKVVQAAPENLLAQRLLGDTCLLLNQPTEALHCFKMALLLAPQDVQLTAKVHELEKQVNASSEFESYADAAASAPTIDSGIWEMPPTDENTSDLVVLSPVEDPVSAQVAGAEWELGIAKANEPWGVQELEDPEEQERVRSQVDAILGASEEEESFEVANLSSILEESAQPDSKEITTETLGDLYFRQGQFGQSLKIFERIAKRGATPELVRKITQCRARLGVDSESMIRKAKIESLRGVLGRLHSNQKP